jgi:CheY-like chemotaxis protein
MGGDVSCLGHPSGGAVFRLVLPLPAASPPASATRETHVPAALRGRVLLAEDNEVNAIVAQALLARHGVEVRTATDGRSTVELASREAFDLILMDAQMPELDGFEAAAAIRIREAEQGRRRTPIVAVTANAQPSDRARSLAAGMDDHLAKPYRDDELEAVLRRYLAASA